MSAFSLSVPINTDASAHDEGSLKNLNTPVAVVAGNQGSGIVDLINAVSGLTAAQNAPAQTALENFGGGPFATVGGGGGNGSSNWWWLIIGGAALWVIFRK